MGIIYLLLSFSWQPKDGRGAINACVILICLVIILCAKQVKCCSLSQLPPLFRKNTAWHKDYPWSKVTFIWRPFSFISVGVASAGTRATRKFFWFRERSCPGLQGKSIKRSASAVILSIKGRLTEWVMSGNQPSVRERRADTSTVWPCSMDDTYIK